MRALITGVCGQDGWYLSEFLVSKGYEVIGTRRGGEEPPDEPPDIQVVFGDVSDALCMQELVEKHKPDEIYNLAAITHVGDSFSAMAASFQVNAVGAANCLNAGARIGAKVYQASTSELFGDTPPPQAETSPMRPRSPYACAKLAAYWLTRNYRERGIYACQGILFNHESPRRGGGFVTQRVARGVADILKKRSTSLTLGNLESCRDWGHAKDYVQAMWLIMQQPKPDDYIVATGQMHSVRELCHAAFSYVGLDYREYVKTSPELKRPLEVEQLCGDPSKIMSLGWRPTVNFSQLIREMVDAAVKQ